MSDAKTAAPARASGPLQPLYLAVGGFFFKFRNGLFPLLFVVIAIVARPALFFGRSDVDLALRLLGVAVALGGQAVRLLTIGFQYIERGGKGGKVYASQLVQGGVYALTRNPMYLGNTSIAVGLSLFSGSPVMCLLVIPLFLFIYQAIMVTEETYLRTKFGAEYDAYCKRVNRFWPSLSRAPQELSRATYDWRKAFRKDLGTITGVAFALAAFPLWRRFWLEGSDAARSSLVSTLSAVGIILAAYAVLHHLKKTRKFFYSPEEV